MGKYCDYHSHINDIVQQQLTVVKICAQKCQLRKVFKMSSKANALSTNFGLSTFFLHVTLWILWGSPLNNFSNFLDRRGKKFKLFG